MSFLHLRHSDGYQHRKHNKNLLMVHLIFGTKYRHPILQGELSERVKQLLFEVSMQKHWYIRRMETDKDHVHILLQYNPADSITSIVTLLKQYSTYHLWDTQSSVLKQFYWKEHTLWSDGYFACSIGNVSRATIERYIENQG